MSFAAPNDRRKRLTATRHSHISTAAAIRDEQNMTMTSADCLPRSSNAMMIEWIRPHIAASDAVHLAIHSLYTTPPDAAEPLSTARADAAATAAPRRTCLFADVTLSSCVDVASGIDVVSTALRLIMLEWPNAVVQLSGVGAAVAVTLVFYEALDALTAAIRFLSLLLGDDYHVFVSVSAPATVTSLVSMLQRASV